MSPSKEIQLNRAKVKLCFKMLTYPTLNCYLLFNRQCNNRHHGDLFIIVAIFPGFMLNKIVSLHSTCWQYSTMFKNKVSGIKLVLPLIIYVALGNLFNLCASFSSPIQCAWLWNLSPWLFVTIKWIFASREFRNS